MKYNFLEELKNLRLVDLDAKEARDLAIVIPDDAIILLEIINDQMELIEIDIVSGLFGIFEIVQDGHADGILSMIQEGSSFLQDEKNPDDDDYKKRVALQQDFLYEKEYYLKQYAADYILSMLSRDINEIKESIHATDEYLEQFIALKELQKTF